MRLTTVKIFVTLFALFLVSSIACKKSSNPSPPPTSDVKLKDGLLLYLPFDGNIADSSGNGNPTVAVGGAMLTYDEHGNGNSAFGGTGSGERIKVTNNGSIKFDTAFSISFNFTQRNNTTQTFLSMVVPSNGYAPTFSVGTSRPGLTNFDFAVNDSLAGCDNTGVGQPGAMNDTTSFVPEPESWYNVVCIYHKGTIQTFVNGKLMGTKTGTGTTTALLCPAAQIIIGAWWDGAPASIDGKIDEVRLYNRVLNQDEITELAKNFQSEN